LAANEKIAFQLKKKKFFTKFKTTQFVVWLRVQNAAQEIRENRGILNRVRLSWTRRAEACVANDGKNFEQLLLLKITVFVLCCLSLC
jgi:hypothetical protein